MNKAIIIGNLGRDAEVRYTTSGSPVATFSVATTESWTDKSSGQRKEQTEWHRIVLWGKSAESLKDYLTKGKQVAVEGRIQTRQWEKDGQKHYTTEINASRITLLGGGGGDRQGRRNRDEEEYDSGYTSSAPEPSAGVPSEEDIPF